MRRASSVLWLHIVTCKVCVHISYRSQYATITLTMPCASFTYLLLTKRVTFSQVLTLAPWRWFPCKLKHVGAFLLILECFNNSTFFNIVCVSCNKKVFNISYEFTLTRIQQKSCFIMTMQGCTHIWRLRKPSQKFVAQFYPIYSTALI